MANFPGFVLTPKGRDLLAKAQTGVPLVITRVGVGDGVWPDGQAMDSVTALVSERKSLPIQAHTIISEGVSRLTVVLTNVGLIEGFFIREIGVYADDPDIGEILYSVTYSGSFADYVPAAGGAISVEEVLNIHAVTGNATNVTVQVSPQALALVKDVQAVRDDLNSAVAGKGAHLVRFSTEESVKQVLDCIRTPRLGEVLARMAAGQAVRIACYGDSITDGNGTTGHVYNRDTGIILPSASGAGSDVGQSNHTDEALFAWPAVLRTLLRDMYGNANLQVWNAGYSGTHLDDGWAFANYEQAIVANPYYGTPDICVINFGWNDVAGIGTVEATYRTELEKLVRKVLGYGTLPVLLTCDAANQQIAGNDLNVADRENTEISRNINAVIASVASKYNLPMIDVHAAMAEWIANNEDGYHWASIIPDDLHAGDIGHAWKAGFLAASLFRDTVWSDGACVERIMWQDSRSGFRFDETDIWTGAADEVYSRNPHCWNIVGANYAPGDVVMDMWVFVDQRNPTLIYRSFMSAGASSDAAKIRAQLQAELPRIEVRNAISYSAPIHDQPVPCSGDIAIHHASDRPFPLCRLRHGLNRIRLFAPNPADPANKYTFFGGFWEINPHWLNSDSAAPFDYVKTDVHSVRDYAPYRQSNALAGVGRIIAEFTHDGSDALTHYLCRSPWEFVDGSNCFALSKPDGKVEILLNALMRTGSGLLFGAGRALDSDAAAESAERCLMFYLASTYYSLVEMGDPGDFVHLKQVTTANPFPAEGTGYRVKISAVLEQVDIRRYKISLYDGWGLGRTLLLEYDTGVDTHPTYGESRIPAVAGVAGGYYFNLGVGSTNGIEIDDCIIRHYGL